MDTLENRLSPDANCNCSVYQMRIEQLKRRMEYIEKHMEILDNQNDYYIMLIKEKGDIIEQLQSIISSLESLLSATVEELKNEQQI